MFSNVLMNYKIMNFVYYNIYYYKNKYINILKFKFCSQYLFFYILIFIKIIRHILDLL